MSTIRGLFDKSKAIDRRIEKVITYDASNEELLRKEVLEYVATESIEQHLENLLTRLDEGMGGGAGTVEVGVWVSGFYGSGKSSFTKYLGFALDPSKTLDGKPFLNYLQNQLRSKPVRQQLGAVAKRHPSAVIMLDLAGEQLAGATLAEISSVLYAKVMQWAGYSRDQKIAYLEFMLERDERFEEFKARISELSNGKSWDDLKNQPLATKALASKAAPEFYPDLFPDSKTFNDIKIEEQIQEADRVRDMLELIRRKSGVENVIIVIDEVGNYVAGRRELITNLDGLAKNIKNIGLGKVWLVATAQQTLMEDDPRAAINTQHLGQLKDRFPITIDLVASDIKEICYSRLLGKSEEGAEALAELFESAGAQLRNAVQLENTKFYKADLDKESFKKYYPFLPHHFEILLRLLGRLAKTRGGVGLRSAIKVIQDVLVEHPAGQKDVPLFADEPVGELATTVRFFNTLRPDIDRPFPHVVNGVDRAEQVFGAESLEAKASKSIAVLQILEDFPVSRENVAAMMHPSVGSASLRDEVSKAIDALLSEKAVPLDEVDGNLRFMSEAVIDLRSEKARITPRSMDLRSIQNSTLKELFIPAPSVKLNGTRAVSTGFKIGSGASVVSLTGDKEPIQTVIQYVPESTYEKRRDECVEDSRQRSSENTIFWIGHESSDYESLALEIYRCREVYRQNRNKAADKEVEEYLRGQDQRADELTRQLGGQMEKGLGAGSFIFRGKPRAVAELDQDIRKAVTQFLDGAAQEVFNRYSEAAQQAESGAAERFLKAERLDKIASKDDPLQLVKGGAVDTSHKAIVSIQNYLETRGQVEGRRVLDDFYAAPYGWSKDTTRYLVAAMLAAGVAKLRIGGEDITTRGDIAVAGVRNTNSFNRIGVALRDNAPAPEALMRARERLLELTGEDVAPLEEDISKCVMRFFPDFQQRYAPLAVRLEQLSLTGVDRAQGIQENLSETLKGDASDAPIKLGSEECPLFDDLQWAREVADAFDNGIGDVVQSARDLLSQIPALPSVGATGELQAKTQTVRDEIRDYIERADFYAYMPDIKQRADTVLAEVSKSAVAFLEQLRAQLAQDTTRLQSLPEWSELASEDRTRLGQELEALGYETEATLAGIRGLMNDRYAVDSELRRIEDEIRRLATPPAPEPGDDVEVVEIVLPRGEITAEDLDAVIRALENLKPKLEEGTEICVTWK